MTDVSQILGVKDEEEGPPPAAPSQYRPSREAKMHGLSRQVANLLEGNEAELPPVVPTLSVKVGNKLVSREKKARPWTWAPFSSSSRTDGALFSHWVRANVEYPDYPFARFDVHLDPVTYSDEEYHRFLKDSQWTKSETDTLMSLARRFELRWPVIHDRWQQTGDFERRIEDLQHRYHHVAALLTQSRISQEAATEAQSLAAQNPPDDRATADQLLLDTAAARALASADPTHQPLMSNLGSGTSNKVFDLQQERQRREHWEALWNRSRQEEVEEAELRKELKHVEAQLRKVKKRGGHIVAAAASRSAKSPPATIEDALASTAPTPMAQTPYLQSGRLVPPETGAGITKNMLTRMDNILQELRIPDLLPTKRVCDLYDQVRSNVLTLLILQKNCLQKEGIVQSRRLQLARMGGNVRVVQEETLLGLTPRAAPSSASSRGGGKKALPQAPPAPAAASKKKIEPTVAAAAAAKKAPAAVKRKRNQKTPSTEAAAKKRKK